MIFLHLTMQKSSKLDKTYHIVYRCFTLELNLQEKFTEFLSTYLWVREQQMFQE